MVLDRLKSAVKYAGYGVLAAGSAAVTTRALQSKAGEIDPPLTGRHDTMRWRGMDISYTEAGEEDDETLVCLHGINAAGSAGEWRAVFDDLAEDHHVVAPDLPGFGCSDRPPIRYSAALYEDFVADFLARYDDPAVLASSLTSSYVAGALDRGDVSASRLALVCPTATGGPEPPKLWLRELLRSPILGETIFAGLTSKPSISYFNADHGYWDPEKAGEDWPEYEWRTAHQSGARFAPASFISGYLNSDVALGPLLAELDVPVTLLWGREADLPPLAEGRDLAEDADATLIVFDDAMLLPHVEFPERFLDAVTGELTEGGESDGESGEARVTMERE